MAEYQVTLINEAENLNQTLFVPDYGYILEAAEDAGLKLPSECNGGSCSSCAARLISGKINQDSQAYLNDEQVAAGWVLLCVAKPMSDCTIETHQQATLLG